MNYYTLEPEVACQLGEKSELDSRVHPPIVNKLHCIFDGWIGDDLLELFPCYIVTDKLKKGLKERKLTGYHFEDIVITKSDLFIELYPNKSLPQFFRLTVTGVKNKDDFVISDDNMLLVSEKAYSFLKKYNIDHCDVK